MIFLAGPETNHWVHRRERMYLRAKGYFADFEKVYGASGVLPSLEGADHFRLRKSLSAAHSRGRLMGQLAVNVLMVAHYFTLKVSPSNYKLKFNPLPSLKPSKNLKFLIAEQRREVRV